MKPLFMQTFRLLLVLLAGGCSESPRCGDGALRLLCGAGLRPALDELLPAFTEETGVSTEPEYAGSGIILTRARQDGVADLFLPGDVYYVDELHRQTSRVIGRVEIASLQPCIIVMRGNPKQIASLHDFTRQDVRVAVGNAEACQVGRTTAQLLAAAGIDAAALQAKESLTVGELGLWVQLGDVDAAVVWDATAIALGGAVEAVPLPVDLVPSSAVTLALLSDARDAAAARDFMRFCLQPRAQGILRRRGYGPPAAPALPPPPGPSGERP